MVGKATATVERTHTRKAAAPVNNVDIDLVALEESEQTRDRIIALIKKYGGKISDPEGRVARQMIEELGLGISAGGMGSMLKRLEADGVIVRELDSARKRTYSVAFNAEYEVPSQVPRKGVMGPKATSSQREGSKTIGRYVDSLRQRAKGGGRQVGSPFNDPEKLKQRIAGLEEQIEQGDMGIIAEMEKRQMLHDYKDRLASLESDEFDVLEQYFIKHGKEWAEARTPPISYNVLREMGVQANVLTEAGFSR